MGIKEKNLNWFQVKMIKKGTKPPIWRRGFVPNGITFAQLAWVLEEMLDCEKTDRYEFEFYHRKERISEWREGERPHYDFFYSFLNAGDTFVNERLETEKWFTFRLLEEAEEKTEYRIELEKLIEEFYVKQNGREIPANSPVISKEVGLPGSWSDANEKNSILKERYQLQSGAADYRNFKELCQEQESGSWGIRVCDNPQNKTGRNQKSAGAMIRDFTDGLNANPNVNPDDLLTALFGSGIAEQKCKKGCKDQESRHPVMKDMLAAYEKNDLVDIAKGLHLRYSRLKKEELAEKIANEILTPAVMKQKLLILEDENIAAFEAAMKRKCFYPTDQEWEYLDAFFGMDYIAYFQDEYVEVPEEVKEVYQKINTPQFQQQRRKINWMMECLTMFGLLYAVAPVRVVYDMFCRKRKFQASYQEFLEVFKSIPEEANSCTILGEKMVLSETLKRNLYQRIEKNQRQVDYYIPSEEEIDDYVQNGYISGESCYWKLKRFFIQELKMGKDEADNLCAIAYHNFARGKMLSDLMAIYNEYGMEFRSPKQVEKFASLMKDANNHTRMFELRGHMPVELAEAKSLTPECLDTKIMPMRSQSRGAVQEKKIYPNDPCPCGSGKKYKKCCGRNKS